MTTNDERHLRRLTYTKAKIEQNDPYAADRRSIQVNRDPRSAR